MPSSLSPLPPLQSLPPPSGPPPPSPSGVRVTATLVSSGDVGDYTSAVQLELRNRLAMVVSLDATQVELEVEPGSVRLRFSLIVDDDTAAAALATQLLALLRPASAASALLGVPVEAEPLIFVAGQIARASPAPPPPAQPEGSEVTISTSIPTPRAPPGLPQTLGAAVEGDNENNLTASSGNTNLPLLLALCGTALLAVLALAVACLLMRRFKRPTSTRGISTRAIVVSEPLPTAVAARVEELAPVPALVTPPAACGTSIGSGMSTVGVQLLPVATLQCTPVQEPEAPESPTSDSEPAFSVLKV